MNAVNGSSPVKRRRRTKAENDPGTAGSCRVIGTRLSRRFSAEQRYRQKDLDRMHSLAELTIATISPFQRLRRLTGAEIAMLEAAHIIRCSVRLDGAGEFHLRGTAQMTLEEITNGHH